jgi:RimJ/RimL family protein N-acetyltransferase
VIVGKHVILRPVEERDLRLLAEWRNAPENRRFFFSPFLINPEGQKKWLEGLLVDKNRIVHMVDTHEGESVGMIGLDKIDWRNRSAEGGQILLPPDQRGHGYAEEAVSLMIKYAFEELNMHRLWAEVYSFNKGVLGWCQLFGFQKEGVLREAAFTGGKYHDKVIMGLLREEWLEEQAAADSY